MNSLRKWPQSACRDVRLLIRPDRCRAGKLADARAVQATGHDRSSVRAQGRSRPTPTGESGRRGDAAEDELDLALESAAAESATMRRSGPGTEGTSQSSVIVPASGCLIAVWLLGRVANFIAERRRGRVLPRMTERSCRSGKRVRVTASRS